jgi:hypothetical protein
VKEVVAEQAPELRLLKKRMIAEAGNDENPASGTLEIARLVEQSHLPARPTLEKLGIPRSTFNR